MDVDPQKQTKQKLLSRVCTCLYVCCTSGILTRILQYTRFLDPFERCSKPMFGAKGRKEVLTHMLELFLRDSHFSLRAMQGT